MNRRSFFTLLLAALGLGLKSHARQSTPAWVPCNSRNPYHAIRLDEMPPHGITDPCHSHNCYPWPPCPFPRGYVAQWTNPNHIPEGWKQIGPHPFAYGCGVTDPGHCMHETIWIEKL